MSAEVETMFSASREVPWHGLGTIVQDAPTSADAIRLAGLDWEVEGRPVFTDEGLLIPNHKANVRSTDKKVLGMVSDRYQIVQNKDAFDFTDALIGEGCQYETAGSLFGGKKIWLLAKMPQQMIVDDAVDPYLCFTNSHDGFGAIRAICTPVRVVCNNTLSLALSGATRAWSTKHVGNLEAKMEEARHTLQLANDYMSELAVVADKLAHTKIMEEDVAAILDDLFPVNDTDSDRRKQNIKEVRDKFMVCMFAPDILKFKGTAWGLVNAASDFATHVTPKRITDTFAENNFNRVLDGHAVIDNVFAKAMARV